MFQMFHQFNSVDVLLDSMKKLPSAVFMVADLTEEERKKIEGMLVFLL